MKITRKKNPDRQADIDPELNPSKPILYKSTLALLHSPSQRITIKTTHFPSKQPSLDSIPLIYLISFLTKTITITITITITMPGRIVTRMVALLGLLLLMLMAATTTKTHALIPYPTRPSSLSLWDMTDDPFRILEQTPFTIPRDVSAAALQDTLALARADWKETATAHVITLDIPGMKKEDVKIEVEENRVLRISGERKTEEQVEGDKWHRAERTNGKFWRQFRLPGNADVDQIKAHLEDGVLRITVPKFAAEKKRQPKLIDIAHHTTSSDDADIKAAGAKVA